MDDESKARLAEIDELLALPNMTVEQWRRLDDLMREAVSSVPGLSEVMELLCDLTIEEE